MTDRGRYTARGRAALSRYAARFHEDLDRVAAGLASARRRELVTEADVAVTDDRLQSRAIHDPQIAGRPSATAPRGPNLGP